MKIKICVCCEGKCSYRKFEAKDFKDFQSKLSCILGCKEDCFKDKVFQYLDCDGDWITFSSQMEMDMIGKCEKDIRMKMFKKGTVCKKAPCGPCKGGVICDKCPMKDNCPMSKAMHGKKKTCEHCPMFKECCGKPVRGSICKEVKNGEVICDKCPMKDKCMMTKAMHGGKSSCQKCPLLKECCGMRKPHPHDPKDLHLHVMHMMYPEMFTHHHGPYNAYHYMHHHHGMQHPSPMIPPQMVGVLPCPKPCYDYCKKQCCSKECKK